MFLNPERIDREARFNNPQLLDLFLILGGWSSQVNPGCQITY